MKMILQSRKVEVPGVESFIFDPQEKLSWKAGQFFHYVLHHRPTDDRGSDRWFTCSAAPHEGVARITTRLASEKGSTFKNSLFELKVGDEIEISDVDGEFVVEDLEKEYVFIAGGIGITPFRSILKELAHAGNKIHAMLLYSNRDENVTYKDELEGFAKNDPGLKIHYITAPERIDEKKIRELIPDLQKPLFYVSGPKPMVEDLAKALAGMGVRQDNILTDDFPGYPME